MRVLVLGATGAVGAELLLQALACDDITLVVAPTRTPLPSHPKLMNPVVNFDALEPEADYWHVDIALCALGTTRKIAGSAERFIQVDKDIPLSVARLVLKKNARCFGLVSSLGAKPGANLYLNTKAELEQSISALGYEQLVIARPSLIDAHRTQRRPAERWGIRLAKCLGPLVPLGWRPIKPCTIARALLRQCLNKTAGVTILESVDLKKVGALESKPDNPPV